MFQKRKLRSATTTTAAADSKGFEVREGGSNNKPCASFPRPKSSASLGAPKVTDQKNLLPSSTQTSSGLRQNRKLINTERISD